MELISFISLCLVCLFMSAAYSLFASKKGWKGLLARELGLLSVLAFSLVLGSFNTHTNSTTLFLVLALAVLMIKEMFASGYEDERGAVIAQKALAVGANVFLTVSVLSISQFHIVSLFAGMFLGLGCELLLMVLKKEEFGYLNIFALVEIAFLGAIVGVGLNNVIFSKHLVSAVLMFLGALVFFVGSLMKRMNFSNKILCRISGGMIMIGLAIVACSTYFY